LATQRPANNRIRNATFDGVQDPEIVPIVPENWASPDELSGTATVSIIMFGGPGGLVVVVPRMQIRVPLT
jgi:hypothetical protein